MKCDFCDRTSVKRFIVRDSHPEYVRYTCGCTHCNNLARAVLKKEGHTEWKERISAPFYGDTLSYEVDGKL